MNADCRAETVELLPITLYEVSEHRQTGLSLEEFSVCVCACVCLLTGEADRAQGNSMEYLYMAHYGGKTGAAFHYGIEVHTVHGGADVTMTLSTSKCAAPPSSGPLGKSSPSEPPWDQNCRNFEKLLFPSVPSKRWLFLCVRLAVQSHIPQSRVGQLAFRVFGIERVTYGSADPGVRS